jgi:hypothetical protein
VAIEGAAQLADAPLERRREVLRGLDATPDIPGRSRQRTLEKVGHTRGGVGVAGEALSRRVKKDRPALGGDGVQTQRVERDVVDQHPHVHGDLRQRPRVAGDPVELCRPRGRHRHGQHSIPEDLLHPAACGGRRAGAEEHPRAQGG